MQGILNDFNKETQYKGKFKDGKKNGEGEFEKISLIFHKFKFIVKGILYHLNG